MNKKSCNILSDLAATASGTFEEAKSIPPSMYHDTNIYDLEVERLFHKDWICIGRLEEIPKVGDYICRDIIGSEVFVIRQRNQSVKAFANVCLHRCASLLKGNGHVTRISCPYHSWTYGLDGQLIGAPFMDRTPNFDKNKFKLKELKCDIWEGFVYVSLDENITSLDKSLAGITDLVKDFRMADYVPIFETVETWNTNWKCLVENFMDSYHIHRVHKDSFAKYGNSEDITDLYPGGNQYTYHLIQEYEGRESVYAHPKNTWLKDNDRYKTYLINIFPSHVIQLQPDLLWYLSILPDGIDKISIRWAVSIPAEILADADNPQLIIDEQMELIHQVNSEDRPIVENVFRTTRSPYANQGVLCYLERNLWDFTRYLTRNLYDPS